MDHCHRPSSPARLPRRTNLPPRVITGLSVVLGQCISTALCIITALCIVLVGASVAGADPISSVTTGSLTASSRVTASPTSTVSAAPGVQGPTPPAGDTEDPLTPEQVATQVAQAAQLRGALGRANAQMAALGEQLAEASAKAAAALERVRTTTEGVDAAAATMKQEHQRLESLVADTARTRRQLGQWARQAYVAGGPASTYNTMLTVLSRGTTGDLGHDLTLLSELGVIDSATVDRLKTATTEQQDVVADAARAAHAAVVAQQAAGKAKKEADALVDRQVEVLAELQGEQMRTIGKAEQTRQDLARSKDAEAVAAAAQLAATLATSAPDVRRPSGPGSCTGGTTAGYANGTIPPAALCPLWGAPGQVLRADAAAAFNSLSRSYAEAFGRPLCVTDSYRTRTEQVAVYAKKPTLAAVPGHSNHGWGTAVDLCGGIESFGTLQHAWLLGHAPVHGWYHPSWAEPNGSRPEPWHWEFAG